MSDVEAQLANIQQSIQVLQQMIENINCRTIDIVKEQNKVKYMLELRKAKQLSSSLKEMTEEDIKMLGKTTHVFRQITGFIDKATKTTDTGIL